MIVNYFCGRWHHWIFILLLLFWLIFKFIVHFKIVAFNFTLNLETAVIDSKFVNFLIYELNCSELKVTHLCIRSMKIDIDLVTSHYSLVRTHCSIRCPLLLLLWWFLYWKYYMNLHKIKRQADILQLNYYPMEIYERKKYRTRSNG